MSHAITIQIEKTNAGAEDGKGILDIILLPVTKPPVFSSLYRRFFPAKS